jgi:diguanylate cyclase (GGDEF)-like protein/PAS domain S-box-containing protein/putative nucleotidyltransferase with HDIG domain
MTAILAPLRLAVAMVCVGVSLIVGSSWLGLVPPADGQQRTQEAKLASIAVVAQTLAGQEKWDDLSQLLTAWLDRDKSLAEICVSTPSKQITVKSRHGQPAVEHYITSLSQEGQNIGEVRLSVNGTNAWPGVLTHPTLPLLGFFVVAGIGVYAVFANRLLHGFQMTPMIPNRIRDALDTLSEGLLVMDERERIVLANRSFCKMVGLQPQQLIASRVGALPWACVRLPSVSFPWTRAIRESSPQIEQLLRYKLRNGTFRFFSINCSPIETEGIRRNGAVVTFRDVTAIEERRAETEQMLAILRTSREEIRSKNRELEVLATQDALTGCLNRRALFQAFEVAWSAAKQQQSPIACLLFDTDHFKSINDTYGHQVGDEVLRTVAKILHNTFPSPALVCRYGGEEFCVVMPATTVESARQCAEDARQKIQAIRLQSPAELRLTTSIGVSEISLGASNPQELINQADQCLYAAKGSGRNRVMVYHESMESVVQPTGLSTAETSPLTDTEVIGLPFQAVTALVSALAYRDTETAEHSRRVADLCVRVASGLLDQRSTYVLEIAALLHDIGKIGVPDHVLLKPGPLTEEEWKMMRRHDRIGVEIVSSTFNCEELSEIIRTHHTFYGATSHEQVAVEGTEISIGARLLSIADSYDAMVSDRVYRSGRSHQAAIAELRRCAGTQFDPMLVEHFAATIGERNILPMVATNSLPKQTAMQIGLQIERLADALDARDVEGLQTLASRLGAMARHHRIESIAVAAEKIEAVAAEENMQWIHLLRDTQLLLNLCRSTQNVFLSSVQQDN